MTFPNDEAARLDVLRGYKATKAGLEPRFDDVVKFASQLFHVPIAILSLIDEERQWFKARIGIDGTDLPRSVSFCNKTILNGESFVILDAKHDPGFRGNPFVTGTPFIRFYAGATLRTSDGFCIGTLCIADDAPRDEFSSESRTLLRKLADLATEQFERRRIGLREAAAACFVEAATSAMIGVDHSGEINFANNSALCLLGYREDELIGESVDVIVPDRMKGAHRAGMRRVVDGQRSTLAGKPLEMFARRKDGSELAIEMTISVLHNADGIGFGATMHDITDRRERDARLHRLANFDPLTNLHNRTSFTDELGDMVRRRIDVTVIMIDLDGFKQVNDTLGHAMGDALLQAFAVRLLASQPKGSSIARMGGDEFAVLLPGTTDPETAMGFGLEIQCRLSEAFVLNGHDVRIGAGVGCAFAHGGSIAPDEIVANADLALYAAKNAGENRVRLFEPQMRAAVNERRAMQIELTRAYERGEFLLHYQPQIDLRDSRLLGVEALLRWHHPQRGILAPGDFLPVLETMSLASPVGWWVLDEACRQVRAWRELGLADIRVSVNLFSSQLRSDALQRRVSDALERYAIAPPMLEIELTETIAIDQQIAALAAIRGLRDVGVRIALDDFGTGYASLSSLQRFPITTLKIDRSFVREFGDSQQTRDILSATIALGNRLGLETIAEGIETVEQALIVRLMGCDIGQGYLFGKPMPADEIMWMYRPNESRGMKFDEAQVLYNTPSARPRSLRLESCR